MVSDMLHEIDTVIASGSIYNLAYNNPREVKLSLVKQTQDRIYFLGSDGLVYYVEFSQEFAT